MRKQLHLHEVGDDGLRVRNVGAALTEHVEALKTLPAQVHAYWQHGRGDMHVQLVAAWRREVMVLHVRPAEHPVLWLLRLGLRCIWQTLCAAGCGSIPAGCCWGCFSLQGCLWLCSGTRKVLSMTSSAGPRRAAGSQPCPVSRVSVVRSCVRGVQRSPHQVKQEVLASFWYLGIELLDELGAASGQRAHSVAFHPFLGKFWMLIELVARVAENASRHGLQKLLRTLQAQRVLSAKASRLLNTAGNNRLVGTLEGKFWPSKTRRSRVCSCPCPRSGLRTATEALTDRQNWCPNIETSLVLCQVLRSIQSEPVGPAVEISVATHPLELQSTLTHCSVRIFCWITHNHCSH